MNAYDPKVHGVRPWPRPVVDTRDAMTVAAYRRGRGRCACGLEVRATHTPDDALVWVHFVGDTRVDVIIGDPDKEALA